MGRAARFKGCQHRSWLGYAADEDAEMIKQAQRTAIMRDPTMAAATLVSAQADAMKAAASNKAGAMTRLYGHGYGYECRRWNECAKSVCYGPAATAGAAADPATPAAPAADGWKCACGATVSGNFCPNCGGKKPQPQPAAGAWKCKCGAMATGKFCPECGSPKPANSEGWTCTCGTVNKGKFCQNCGAKNPRARRSSAAINAAGAEDPTNPPKFCPECGDIFDDNDKKIKLPLRRNCINGSVISVRYERLKQKAVHTAERALRGRIGSPAGETAKKFFVGFVKEWFYICSQKEILL